MKILKRCCTNVLYYTFYYQNLFAYLCQRCQLKFLEQAISAFVVMNVAVELSNTCILLQYIKRFPKWVMCILLRAVNATLVCFTNIRYLCVSCLYGRVISAMDANCKESGFQRLWVQAPDGTEVGVVFWHTISLQYDWIGMWSIPLKRLSSSWDLITWPTKIISRWSFKHFVREYILVH